MIVVYRFLFAILLLAAWAWPAAAQAQINRCGGPDGSTIYTDRRCDEIGAVSRLPRGEAGGAIIGPSRRYGCARTLQDLVYEITAAIDNRDVNRLGGVYHWVGVGASEGYRIMDRLQVIADRSLVDIAPVHGGGAPVARAQNETPDTQPEDRELDPVVTTTRPDGTVEDALPRRSDGIADAVPPPRRTRRVPVALRLHQTTRSGTAPTQIVFGLRRHLDCWWVTL